MRNISKTGILTLSTVLSFGMLAPTVSAATQENQQERKAKIQVMSAETVVTKEDLIEKFKEIFPKKYESVKDADFFMNGAHHYPDDDTIRYDLNFHKTVNGKDVNGGVSFVGEDLKLERFHYDPANTAEALFPAKLSKEEAKGVALSFLEGFSDESHYQLDTNHYLHQGNQTLTEPIRYSFSFVRTKNGVPVSDQRISVEVLGNGEVVGFSRRSQSSGSATYDEVDNVQAEEEILQKIKENLSVDLRYQIDNDPETDERNVKLIYQPVNGMQGVHAISGKWQIGNGFSSDLPERKDIDMITDEALEPKQADFSIEDAKSMAKELLAVDSEEVTLSIQSIDERENYNGQEVISINYMYEYRNGGHGTNLELDPDTGEIIQYHDIKREVLPETGKGSDEEEKISSDAALEQAVEYLKEFAPSYLHNYAMPTGEPSFDEERRVYHFNFPRVVNGILVEGDGISVRVAADGSLLGLNVRKNNVEDWPSSEDIISEEKALAKFKEDLNVDLRYVKERESEEDHYNLVYIPIFNENPSSFLNANTGNWESRISEGTDGQAVTHSWAEDELNYLISAGILNIEDPESFDADQAVTKGEAIEVMMKSLTRFYGEHYPEDVEPPQSFENIDSEHPLYQVIEHAVTMGILETENATFDIDEPITREELAVWYVRALGLGKAAEYSSIYQLDFTDVDDIEDEHIGYVALADSVGVLPGVLDRFYPDQEVSYAQLAMTNVRLAHEVYEEEPSMRY